MKKLLAIMLSAAAVLSMAGCGKTNETAENATGEETAETAETANLAIACELTSEEYGIGFRKGSDLTETVNGYIAELKEDGTLDELAAKYELTIANLEPSETEEAVLEDVEEIKTKGKLVIGITDYEPMNFKDDNNEWTGFDTEFAQAVCEKLGVEAEFIEIDWDNKFTALESKAIDCIWNGMTISEDVLKNTSCSVAYVKNAQVVVMNADKAAEYATPESMAELSFAVESGSAGATAAEENAYANIVEVGTQTDALLEVQSGSCDACIIDLTMANAMVK